MFYQYCTDWFWVHAEKHWPRAESPRGRKSINSPRLILDAILFVLRTGMAWRCLPRQLYGPWQTIYRWFRRLAINNFFTEIFNESLQAADAAGLLNNGFVIIDSCSVRATEGGDLTGRSYKDNMKTGTKWHLAVDGNGIPLALLIGSGNQHDAKMALSLVDTAAVPAGSKLLGDKGYDNYQFRAALASRDIVTDIPRRISKYVPHEAGIAKYRCRWKVEAAHAWLMNRRRIRIRYERSALSYQAFCHAACVEIINNRLCAAT
jgi:transposase